MPSARPLWNQRPRGRARLAWPLLCLLLAWCAGCASIPTSGPVVSQTRPPADQRPGWVAGQAKPPPADASPSLILRGFLTAMADFSSNYDIAKQYLTRQAAAVWDPAGHEVEIYSSDSTRQDSDDPGSIIGTRIGSLRTDGSFVADPLDNWVLDLGLVQEDGQWRVSTPPPGLAMSQNAFSQAFDRVNVYFFPLSGGMMVADSRWVQPGQWSPTEAAALVLAGPSDWLSAIVGSHADAAITLTGPVEIDGAVVEVPLSDQAAALSGAEAAKLALEIAATLTNTGVTTIRLLCQGRALALDGAGADGSLEIRAADAFRPAGATPVGTGLMGVLDQTVVSLADDPPQALAGDWGTTPRAIASFAVRWSAAPSELPAQIAAVTDQGLLTGPADGSQEPQTRWEKTDLLRPQYDHSGALWAVSPGEGTPEVMVLSDAQATALDTSALSGMRLMAFQVSPDARRLAVVRQIDLPDGVAQEAGVALIAYRDGAPSAVVAYRPVRLVREGLSQKSILDLAWLGPSSSSLLVLAASSADARPGVFASDIDGCLEMTEWGLRQAWTPADMAVLTIGSNHRVVIRDREGWLWTYATGQSWVRSEAAVTAIAFPV